ncbi:MAG: hypothetical protein HQK74_03800 [Desulfamplus sp.]|nr:hypothetical protein [Desulfamplus sp.]
MSAHLNKMINSISSPNSIKPITIIDETIREGMQYRGVVFSFEERAKILEFQEILGVDISQVGYPSAHFTEVDIIKGLTQIVAKNGYKIRVAGMGRASTQDVESLVKSNVADCHLHAHIKLDEVQKSLTSIKEAVGQIRQNIPNAKISIAILDIGTSSMQLLEIISKFLVNETAIDILSLPDTSGIMSPDSFYGAVSSFINKISMLSEDNSTDRVKTEISVHCHNDLGVASANTFMGVRAGATVVELSALGIGERNGIGDLFTVAKMLKDRGYNFRLNVNDIKRFKEYYRYVSDICKAQTGEALINYNTPFFGDGVKTHVAGTHAGSGFGLFSEKDGQNCGYNLNVLCGKNLVKRYLESMDIPYISQQLEKITESIKSQSAKLGRRLEKDEITEIVKHIYTR